MRKTLFLICPTDIMESIIQAHFQSDNYFYTSLGNSLDLNNEITVRLIKQQILDKDITQIIFVLKEDNPILKDVMCSYKYRQISCLQHLYHEAIYNKSMMSHGGILSDAHKSYLSRFLINKVCTLKNKLNGQFSNVKVNAFIYKNKYPYFFTNEPNFSLCYFSMN